MHYILKSDSFCQEFYNSVGIYDVFIQNVYLSNPSIPIIAIDL